MTSIAFIIDFITYLSVFCFVFHLKLKKSVLHISLGCVWAVLGSCFLYLYSPDFSYRIIILFGLYLLFQAKLDHVLVCFSLYTLISYLAECYGIYFYSLLTGTNVLDNPLILSLCRIFVSLFFLLLCITFYRGTMTIFPFSQLSAKNNLFISGLCFLHLGLMGMLNAFFNYDMSTVGRRLMVILTLILLLMFSTIFYLYLKLKKSKEKLEENSRLQQYQWELEKQHYLDLQKKDQALRKFRHDYKHHILAMQELAARKDYGELLTYLNDLSHIQSQTASISTNNPVADAIFNYFDSIKPAHTEFCVDGRFQPHCFVSETHLCILLSNLLINAMEAVEKCPPSAPRQVFVSLFSQEERLTIRVTNTFFGSVEPPDLSSTTKKDFLNHGLGIQNMRDVVSQYNGTIQFSHTGQSFEATIHLGRSLQ
mgnify:FL=1